ncbi:MAG TPA: carboxyl transferase domain-containing protein [Candidatus Limiplasma sp.]|nr:carboxyl transferase domain-containing protein [Candidatus Limiplasma sp.]
MQNSQDLTKVQALRDALNTGDEKRIKAQRDAGKLTARERIEKLVDNGSFVETYALVSENGGAAGVVTGYATIQNRPVYLFAQDFTVHGGAMGKLQAQKINKTLDLALKTGAPVLALCDSAGVRVDEGAEAMNAYAEIYRNMARLSGVCPMVAVVLGPCIGGAALIAQLADVSIMAKKVSSMMVFGPQVLAAMNGVDVKIDALGGAEMMAKQGGCSLVAADEAEALELAVKTLSLLPGCNAEDAELVDGDDMNRLLSAVEADKASAVLADLFDAGTMLELKAAYETGVHTAMGRIAGHSVGVVATEAGYLTAGALQKAARFVHFMDCFNLPVVSMLNTSGVKIDKLDNQSWLMNAQSQLLYAYATATVPKLCVVTGSAVGQAYVAMGGKANADVTYAWPGAIISALTPEAAVAVLYGDEVKADKGTPDEARAKYAAKYVEEVAGALKAAEAGLVDDVIDPAQTRKLLAAALEMLFSKRDSNPAKKHGNMPL